MVLYSALEDSQNWNHTITSDCEICALLGYYAASCGNLPTFRDNIVPIFTGQRVRVGKKESQQPVTQILESTCGVAISRRDDSQ
jgi:hypothetical protein